MDEIARMVETPVSRWYLCIFPGDIGFRGEFRVGREERRSERLRATSSRLHGRRHPPARSMVHVPIGCRIQIRRVSARENTQ